MAYILGFVVVGILFVLLHYFTELSKNEKISVTVVFLSIILFGIFYNTRNNEIRDKMLNVVTTFKQGKTISCDDIKVNDKEYSLSIGTYTFIGKENTPNYGRMISASNCK